MFEGLCRACVDEQCTLKSEKIESLGKQVRWLAEDHHRLLGEKIDLIDRITELEDELAKAQAEARANANAKAQAPPTQLNYVNYETPHSEYRETIRQSQEARAGSQNSILKTAQLKNTFLENAVISGERALKNEDVQLIMSLSTHIAAIVAASPNMDLNAQRNLWKSKRITVAARKIQDVMAQIAPDVEVDPQIVDAELAINRRLK